MCKESKKQESTTSTSSIPAWLEGVSQKVATKAGDLTDKPFESYTGQRVADFSGDQMSAFQKLRDLVSGGETPAAIGKYTNAPAQNIGTERVVDEGGRLGQIADYMNPHVAGALQPALAKIQEQADAQRKRLSAGATSAGAFGDARHGVVESKLDQNTSQAMGDTASQFYMNAFDRAMGQRTGDLNRFGDVDKTNAAYDEKALERQLTGGKEMQANMLQQIQALLSAGGQQQMNKQVGLDATFEEFMRKYGHDERMMKTVASVLGAIPHTKTGESIKGTTAPDNSGMALAGSVAKAALPALLAMI